MPASDHEVPAQTEFACARCWKQKKKCDKVAPRCGRCTLQTAVCVYSTHPPKESVFTVKPIKVPDESWLAPYQVPCLSLDPPAANHSASNTNSSAYYRSTNNLPIPGQVSHDNWKQNFTSQVQDIFAASGKDAKTICESYFTEFHPWLSFMSEADFWRDFSSAGSHPEFSTLLLSMYLMTHLPEQNFNHMEILDPVYSTAKNAWSHLLKYHEPSIVLIQAGLLIATYESGQALTEKSRTTMVACAEMGYKMRLHKSLRRNVEDDLCGQNELKAQRRLWWGIMGLERLLAVKDLDHGYIFATPHPKLDDYLPSNHEGSFSDIPSPKVVGTTAKDTLDQVELFFPDTDSYPAVVQSCYLLGRVMNHIKSNIMPLEQQERELTFLDGTIQTFARSLLRQATSSNSASTIQGHYCTPFFLSLIALVTLHRHELKQYNTLSSQQNPHQNISAESSPLPRPIVALRVLGRMFHDITGQLKFSENELLKFPCFQIHNLYLTLWLYIMFGDKCDEVEIKEGSRHALAYLRVVKRKWRIAEVYVAEIAALQTGGLGNEYAWLTQT